MSSRIERLKVGPIGENVYAIESMGVGVLVDPGADAELILSFLEKHGFRISLIALTHGHLDHCAAIPDLLEAWKGKRIEIAVHRDDARYLGASGEEANRAVFDAIRAPSYFMAFWRLMPEASIFLEDGATIPGTSLKVLHTPGHSPGSICFLETELLNADAFAVPPAKGDRAGVGGLAEPKAAPCIVSGDTLFRGGVGRVDTPDADPASLETSLRRLSLLPSETIVFPGHGPRTTIGREFSAS